MFEQIFILILGSLAIFLIAIKNKWGFVVGLLSQPFWVYSAYKNEQWGIFILSIVYIINWSIGIYNHFKK